MGYTTEFSGELKFTREMRSNELAYLKSFFHEDIDDHPEWKKPKGDISYIQFEITDDFTGIKWDGSEKFYYAENAVNFIIINMQEKFGEFGLTGQLIAQGETYDDKWVLKIKDGVAVREELKIEGDVYRCPHCDGEVITSEATKIQ